MGRQSPVEDKGERPEHDDRTHEGEDTEETSDKHTQKGA